MAACSESARYLEDEDTFLLTYGDGLGNVDISSLLDFHRKHGRLATVTSVPPISRFGVLEMTRRAKSSASLRNPRPTA